MWTYLKHDAEGCLTAPEEKMPPKGSAFLAFDTFRWKVQIGFREAGVGCISLLNPNVDDDCNVVAWAPLGTPTAPDESNIRAHCSPTWHQAINSDYAQDGIRLLR